MVHGIRKIVTNILLRNVHKLRKQKRDSGGFNLYIVYGKGGVFKMITTSVLILNRNKKIFQLDSNILTFLKIGRSG